MVAKFVTYGTGNYRNGSEMDDSFIPFTSMDSSTITLWTGLFAKAGCLVSFYYFYHIKKFLKLIQTVYTLIRCNVLIWVCNVCQLPF